MKDESKTKKQLIEELKIMRQRLDEYEKGTSPDHNLREALLCESEERHRSLFDNMLD
jgi:hypothetical protein